MALKEKVSGDRTLKAAGDINLFRAWFGFLRLRLVFIRTKKEEEGMDLVVGFYVAKEKSVKSTCSTWSSSLSVGIWCPF